MTSRCPPEEGTAADKTYHQNSPEYSCRGRPRRRDAAGQVGGPRDGGLRAAAGGARSRVEQNLRQGRKHYPFPPGTRIGETTANAVGANSPLAPNTGANVEPFPAGSHPSAGPPPSGDGIDGVPRDIIDGAGDLLDGAGDVADSILPG